MLLQELFQNLNEARRNPGQNEKLDGHPAAVQYLHSMGRDMSDYGVSMTMIPKLGLNPGSRYNTPVGVYFYPAEYYFRRKSGSGKSKLDFQDDAPYIQIFEISGDTEYIDEIDSSGFNRYTGMLFKNINKVAQLMGVSEIQAEKTLSHAIASSLSKSKKSDSYGGRLWYILYSLSRGVGYDGEDGEGDAGKRNSAAPRSAVVWNSLLRLLGMDTVIDNGSGIIHENEPTQGVVLNPRNVKLVKTFENKPKQADDDNTKHLKYLAKVNPQSDYPRDVVTMIRDWNVAATPATSKYCKVIMKKCLDIFKAHPNLYPRFSEQDIGLLLTLNKNAEVIKEITVGYYAAKFSKVKAEMEQMIEDWTVTKSEIAPGTPVVRQKHAHAMSAPQYKRDQASKIIRDLSRFKSDPKAMEMITYLTNALQQLEFNI